MDAETDLFVQAFWVKCRDIIRPELDTAVDALRHAGHETNISTLEYSPDEKTSTESAPTLIMTIHPSASTESRVLRYRGDVVAAVEAQLRRALGVKVVVHANGRGAGRIVIPFTDLDEFQRLLDHITE